ncbi:MAG TPA: hypothetical protein PKA06_10705, partial [Gemmatales bacterium]|nr:hypothetical protein [Gemmatales bacterium]
MSHLLLVLNAGSSSLKFSCYLSPEHGPWLLDTRGQMEAIGSAPRFTIRDAAATTLLDQLLPANLQHGTETLITLNAWLQGRYPQAKLLGVGHRVVHGGSQFTQPVIVNPQILAELKKLVPLAPLHQPYHLAAIEALLQQQPDVPQVACFDTTFHRGQPSVAQL